MDPAGPPPASPAVARGGNRMNRFVDTLNRIRQAADSSWLTPSQQKAKAAILERLKFLDEINLWGSPGTGKTFLGWILRKDRLVEYVATMEQMGPAGIFRTIVIDNACWRRREVREILHSARQSGYDRLILITPEPVQEQMATVELVLTQEDLEWAITNLRRIRVTPYCDTPRTLWELVSPVPMYPSHGGL